jgi:AcrR family transcriptional regulator
MLVLMAASRTRNQYHHGDLKHALLIAAEQQLREHGPAALSLRGVARSAGVSHAAPYRHFSDRAALLQALAERGFQHLQAAMVDATEAVPYGPEQKLIAAGLAYVCHAVQNPEIIQLMFGGGLEQARDGQSGLAGEPVFAALEDIIRVGIDIGVYRQRESRELAMAAWTAMHGLAMLITAGMIPVNSSDPASLDALVSSVASNVIYGISK